MKVCVCILRSGSGLNEVGGIGSGPLYMRDQLQDRLGKENVSIISLDIILGFKNTPISYNSLYISFMSLFSTTIPPKQS